MVHKLKCPSEDSLVSLGTEKKALTSSEGGRNLGGKVDRGSVERGPDVVLGEGKEMKT